MDLINLVKENPIESVLLFGVIINLIILYFVYKHNKTPSDKGGVE